MSEDSKDCTEWGFNNMPKTKDYIGFKSYKLTVIAKAPWHVSEKGKRSSRWVCSCECGETTEVLTYNLISGHTKSCGCLLSEFNVKRNTKHNRSGTTEHIVWSGMIQRCADINSPAYEHYGGRGITVCDRWLESFENFYEDMGERPEGLSLDRVNNDSGYFKENCRWATKSEQALNRRPRKGNTSGVSGVRQRKDSGSWIASLTINSVHYALGTFKNMEDAINARLKAESEHGICTNKT